MNPGNVAIIPAWETPPKPSIPKIAGTVLATLLVDAGINNRAYVESVLSFTPEQRTESGRRLAVAHFLEGSVAMGAAVSLLRTSPNAAAGLAAMGTLALLVSALEVASLARETAPAGALPACRGCTTVQVPQLMGRIG